jgi:hypothetical protein
MLKGQMIAVGRSVRLGNSDAAEVAFVVEDSLDEFEDLCDIRGIAGVEADLRDDLPKPLPRSCATKG